MGFSTTTINPITTLKTLGQIGAYSFEAWKLYNPVLGSVLFGDELFGINTTKSVNFKNMLVTPTTTKDGRSIEWSTIAMKRNSTTVTTGATSATQTVGSTTGMSAGDDVVFVNGTTETRGVIATVDSTTQITLSASITTTTGDIVKRLSFSKKKGAAIDRVDYDPMKNKTSNYIQDFGAKFDVTDDELNSHMDLYFRGGRPDPKAAQKDANGKVVEGVANFLRLKMTQKLGSEIIGDIAAAFIKGEYKTVTDSGKTRYYTGGLKEVVTTYTIAGGSSDDAIFDFIYDNVYDVRNLGQQYGNKKVMMMANNAFVKRFGSLRPDNVRVNTSNYITEYGYGLTKINVAGFEGIDMAYEPILDDVEVAYPVCYILPVDLIGAYRRLYHDINENMDAQTASPDILVQKSVSDQDTLDTTTLYFAYNLGFVFGGWDSVTNFGSGNDLYRRLVIS